MAIFTSVVHDEHNATNYMEFVIDTDADKTSLPGLDTCCPGSKATSIESGLIFVLSTTGIWNELPGSGPSITVEALSVDTNGSYTAPAKKAYSPVVVDVPNAYTTQDEGKVVSNGELVSQGSQTYTENDTYDTTTISSVTVNVAGSGGGGNATRVVYSGTGDIPLEYPLGQEWVEPVEMKVVSCVKIFLGAQSAFGMCQYDSNDEVYFRGSNPNGSTYEATFTTAYHGLTTPPTITLTSLRLSGQDYTNYIGMTTWTITVYQAITES